MKRLTITQKPGETYPTVLVDGLPSPMLIQNLKIEFDANTTGGFVTLRVYVPEVEVDVADPSFTVVDQNGNVLPDPVAESDPA